MQLGLRFGFPAADEVITPQAARRAYEEDAGIELGIAENGE